MSEIDDLRFDLKRCAEGNARLRAAVDQLRDIIELVIHGGDPELRSMRRLTSERSSVHVRLNVYSKFLRAEVWTPYTAREIRAWLKDQLAAFDKRPEIPLEVLEIYVSDYKRVLRLLSVGDPSDDPKPEL